MEYRVYGTGDQVWVSDRYGQKVSVKFISHDGLTWEEGDTFAFRKLTGTEKYIHLVQVFLMKLVLKVLNS